MLTFRRVNSLFNHPHMQTQQVNEKIEVFLVFTLALGLFLSKPIIYAASGTLLAYALVRTSLDQTYRHSLFRSRLTCSCVLLYFLGLFATVVHPGGITELAWTARKLLYLPLLPVLYLAFMSRPVRVAGLNGVLLGFWIAAFFTMHDIGWQWNRGRIDGATWLKDVWGVLTGLFISFLLPSIFERSDTVVKRSVIALTMTAALAMLIMSGARGPLLGVIVGGLLYLTMFQRNKLLFVLVLIAALYLPAKYWMPTQIDYLESRIISMSHVADPDTDSENFNRSNWIRLQLWKTAIAHDTHKIFHEPLTLLFGSGPNNQIHEERAFFENWSGMPEESKQRLLSYGFPSNERHNMYLDSIGKFGILWTAGSILLIIAVAIKGIRSRGNFSQSSLAVSVVTINFLVTGMTYDLLAHWGSFFLVFLTMLAIHCRNSNVKLQTF